MKFRVALLQMDSCGIDISRAISKGKEFCKTAREKGAHLALFPEMWNCGYTLFREKHFKSIEHWKKLAITRSSEFIKHFRSLALELGMAIAVTYLEKTDVLPKNSVTLIDRKGRDVCTYSKVHTCDFDLEKNLMPGAGFKACELDLGGDKVKLGFMICYDREFPESARVLMLKGAEIILVPNCCELDEPRTCQILSRSYENMVGIAVTNYAQSKSEGNSMAFSGIVYPEIDGRCQDTRLVKAGKGEGVFIAEFDLDALRSYRQRETWGDAYRKPGLYSVITEDKARYPFIRKDSRRN